MSKSKQQSAETGVNGASTAAPKPPKTRSPNYPALDLQDVVGKLPALFASMKRHPVGVEVAVKLMGLSYNSSTGKLALASMRAFGLFENSRDGASAMVKLSTRAMDIVTDYPRESAEWWKAIKAAALAPKIHSQLWAKYGASLPADDELRRYLVRDLKFGDGAVVPFIQEYKDTIAFAKLGEGDIIEGNDGDDGDDSDLEDDGNQSQSDRNRGRIKRKRSMSTGLKEDVCSLEEGEAVFQWPENLSKDSAADLQEWLGFIGKKIKRAAASLSLDNEPDDDEDDE